MTQILISTDLLRSKVRFLIIKLSASAEPFFPMQGSSC